MAPEQVVSDRDSEDEVDDAVANLEDRRVALKYISRTFFSSFTYFKIVVYC